MRSGVFLDTSYLITLVHPARDRHAVAKRYFQEFLARKMPMAVSAIVVAEFCVRQKLETLALQQLLLMPFTHEDAVVAATLDYKPFRIAGGDRQSLRDDFKIIGHAESRNFGHLITDDADTMFRYCETLRAGGQVKVRGLKLQDGFTTQAFTPDEQGDFLQVMDEPADDETDR